jgi:hypothetical protein
MLHSIVVDNFFKNVDEVINLSKKLEYHLAPNNENWPGVRTKSLHSTHYDFFNKVILKILNYYYPNTQLKYYNSHVAFSKLKKGDKGKTRFHQDNVKLAAVYSGEKYHGYTSLKSVEKERLTLNVFIEDIEVLS